MLYSLGKDSSVLLHLAMNVPAPYSSRPGSVDLRWSALPQAASGSSARSTAP